MLIHSVMPPQLTIEGLGAASQSLEKVIDGTKVTVEPAGENTVRVIRIISTNPQDFLNPRLQPGSLIPYTLK